MNIFKFFISLFFVIELIVVCMAEDWPRFRGVNGQGISSQAVPTQWSEDKNIKWRCKLPGSGSSSPVIYRNKIFITSFSGVTTGDQDPSKLVRHIVCVDKEKEL